MTNTDYQNPLDMVIRTGCDYKSTLFSMLNQDKTDEQKAKYLSAAAEYRKALKMAIKYLHNDLRNLEKEMHIYVG